MELDRARKKLQEAKTVEERKLLQEVLLDYVGFLREKRSEYVREILRYFYAIVITVPLTVTSLVVTVSVHLYSSMLLLLVMKYLVSIFVITCTILFVLLCIRSRNLLRLEKEIYETYNIVIDPIMRLDKRLDLIIAAAILTAIAIACLIITWTVL